MPDPRFDPHGDKIRAQQAARAAEARREAEVRKAISDAYPHAGPVKIRMLNSGARLEIGYEPAFRAMYEGWAELIRPDGTTWHVQKIGG